MISARSSAGQSIGLRIRCPETEGGTQLQARVPSALQLAKFWSSIRRGEDSSCWLWMGSGRGHTRLLGPQLQVHRAAYVLAVGPLGTRQAVKHTCNEPLCCNPKHLVAEPQGLAMRNRGESNGRSKLTAGAAAEIRRAFAAGEANRSQLARLYGVSPKAIRKVLAGETWKVPS